MSQRDDSFSIVVCEKCGVKNRVKQYYKELQPICGKCRFPLSIHRDVVDIDAAESQSNLRNYFKNYFDWKTICLSFVVCSLLIFIVYKQYNLPFSKQTKQAEQNITKDTRPTEYSATKQNNPPTHTRTTHPLPIEIKRPDYQFEAIASTQKPKPEELRRVDIVDLNKQKPNPEEKNG